MMSVIVKDTLPGKTQIEKQERIHFGFKQLPTSVAASLSTALVIELLNVEQ